MQFTITSQGHVIASRCWLESETQKKLFQFKVTKYKIFQVTFQEKSLS